MTRQRRAGLAAIPLFGVLILASSAACLARPAAGGAVSAALAAPSASVATAPAPKSSVAVAPAHLLVIDFLAYAAEAVASDPIAGSPDA